MFREVNDIIEKGLVEKPYYNQYQCRTRNEIPGRLWHNSKDSQYHGQFSSGRNEML